MRHSEFTAPLFAFGESRNNGFSAFTLAEVLITLAIIGVVCAITIPSLMQKTQDAELKTALKKEYSVLSNAYNSVLNDNGGTIKGLCPGNQVNANCFLNFMSQKLKVQKYCAYGDTAVWGNCWTKQNEAKNPGGGPDWLSTKNYNYSAMILNDGAFVLNSWYDGTNCQNDALHKPDCGALIIDVNGVKGPNIQGKDIFEFYVGEKSFWPAGVQGDFQYNYNSDHTCGTVNDIHEGIGCTAKYLQQ